MISPAELLDAARAVLREEGELGVRAVARRLGVTPSALYRHTEGLVGLQAMVVEDIVREVEEMLVDDRARASADHPRTSSARVGAGADRFRRWALANTAEFDLVLRRGSPPASSTTRWAAAMACRPAAWSIVLGSVVVEVLGHVGPPDERGQVHDIIDALLASSSEPSGP